MAAERRGRFTTEIWLEDFFKIKTIHGRMALCDDCGPQLKHGSANYTLRDLEVQKGKKARCPRVIFQRHLLKSHN
jgi:hypothetical protein